ncbi:MAG: transposase [Candidatus Omnitrophota bacterium]
MVANDVKDCFVSAGKDEKKGKKHRSNLFHFVTNPAVPATNNGTERAIRKAVIIRKISNGNRSEKGAIVNDISF